MPEEPRIGVFVCHCGANIGSFVDVLSVVEYAKTLLGVVHAERHLYTCASDGLKAIQNAIKHHNLNRVIVASCTPRTHEPLFRSVCTTANLNPYLFEFVNIREQCSWVHMHEKEKATQKAKELIKMGVARASLLQPQESIKIDVIPEGLVIGAGIAGISAALNLASQGFKVHLVEVEAEIGGMVNNLNKMFPINEEPKAYLQSLIEKIRTNKNINLYVSSEVKAVEGYIGNFEVTIKTNSQEKKIKVGTIIVATGAVEFKPNGMFGYGKYENVVTQLELERLLKDNKIGKCNNLVMIQCVGARGNYVDYCARVCCLSALKNAMEVIRRFKDCKVTVLHNDIQVYGVEYERYYKQAREMGVRFIRYSFDKPPEIIPSENKTLKLKVYNALIGELEELNADIVALSTPLIQHEKAVELSKILRVPLGSDKFFYEAHVKLRPLDFASDGIYVCGTAHGPADIGESIAQALGAAARASIPMANKSVQVEAITAITDPKKCIGCGICESLCPYRAIRLIDGIANSIEVLCKGCGTCAAACPSKAITCRHFTEEQILAQVRALKGGEVTA